MKFKLALLAVAAAASAQAPSDLQFLTAQIAANGLKADVSFLASDLLEGRGTPSRGLDLAAEYIASEFRRGGLEPAGDDGYFQTANFVSTETVTDGLEFTLETGGKSFSIPKTAIAIQNPAETGLRQAGAVIVGLQDTAALDAMSPDQVRGKALILVMGAPGGAGGRGGFLAVPAAALLRLQPAAVILVTPGGGRAGRGGGRPNLRDTKAPASPTILTVSDSSLAEALAAKPADAKITVHVPAPKTTEVKLRNVVAILRGADPTLKDTYIVVTGHYDHLGIRDNGTPDHIYNGADDDASGTSSVIEIAKALAAMPQRPKRSIVFIALFGEEMGDVGSRYYGNHPIFPLAKTIADVNLEQLGRTDDLEGPRVGAFNLTGFDYSDIHDFFAKAGKQTDIQVVKHEKNSDSYFMRSDNAAFAAVGVPSTTLSVAYNFPDYHQAGDEWPKLDYENMAKVDRTIALGLIDMANSSTVPHWDAANPKVAQYVKAREISEAAQK